MDGWVDVNGWMDTHAYAMKALPKRRKRGPKPARDRARPWYRTCSRNPVAPFVPLSLGLGFRVCSLGFRVGV